MVQAPGFLTLAAQEVRRDWSRSVAVMVSLSVARRFEEEVREDGDGGLALDDGLRGGELAEEFGAGDGDFEVSGGGCGLLGILSCGGGRGGHCCISILRG